MLLLLLPPCNKVFTTVLMAEKGNFYILVGVMFLGGGVAPSSSRHLFSCTMVPRYQ
jgi:hypothetical protein